MRRQYQAEFSARTLDAPIVDEYKGPKPSLLSAGVLPHWGPTKAYLRDRWVSYVRHAMGLRSSKNIPGFDMQLLTEMVADMYVRINTAQSKHELGPLQDVRHAQRQEAPPVFTNCRSPPPPSPSVPCTRNDRGKMCSTCLLPKPVCTCGWLLSRLLLRTTPHLPPPHPPR